ncbi:MAG: phosphate/phosphite/phosphonate ABC transporter substrate-binding protein [Magnetococcales bacterium]|nr:phosphate/phosphite/phosphonate ABC transporter substrate-binding protein [Magnetococcales bacterium]
MLAGLLLVAGCSQEDDKNYRPQFAAHPVGKNEVFLFGVHPLHNPDRLFEIYQPLVEFINRHLQGRQLQLEASRNYDAYEEKFYAGHFHIALPNPYQTVVAMGHGYHVFGKMGDDHNFRGIILVRKDSNLNAVTDLKGKVVSYPAATALAATMLPQWFFHTHGLDVMRDLDNRYVGSQESSIMNVYLGKSAAGATWPLPWMTFGRERPEVAAQLEMRWQTDSLPNNSLVYRQGVPEDLVTQVGEALFSLHEHPEGKALLGPISLSRFEAASNQTYQPVKDFLERFEREVRPIKAKP